MDNTTQPPSKALAAALAAHRFGLGEAQLATTGSDATAWLLGQIGPADTQRGSGLVGAAEGLRRYTEFVRDRRLVQQQSGATSAASAPMGGMAPAGLAPAGMAVGGMAASGMPAAGIEQQFAEHFRAIVQGDVRAHLATPALSSRPFAERLALFWANHFTVSGAKPTTRGVVGAFEREAIRPHIAGSFEALLKAAVQHAGMLRYLDNDSSAGPDSAVVKRLARRPANAENRPPGISGLNENLAREVLELHTLGVSGGGASYGTWGGYTQADVTAFAAVLTGWRVPLRELMAGPQAGPTQQASHFDASFHQPGSKTVLGQRYAEGPQALGEVLHTLAVHPSTARFIAFKLARHFVADEPPLTLVQRLATNFLATNGDLPSLYRTLVLSPEAWLPQQQKLKTPQEFVISTARVLALGDQAFERTPDGGANLLGQRVTAAPSPAGWPDRAEDWLGPDAVWKRVEWATRVADRAGKRIDARALAQASLGPLLTEATARQIERAADGPQALALLLLSPEFQRR
jgi:uncharacterized protein (DUF1800 family)